MNKISHSIKYKLMSFDELVINLDRLSRFKLPEYSFNRVFSSILTKFLLHPKYSAEEITNLKAKYISDIVKEIWNSSVKHLFPNAIYSDVPNAALKLIIKNQFKNIDERTNCFINTNLLISPLLANSDSKAFNIAFLKKVSDEIKDLNQVTLNNLANLREKYNLTYPITKLLIVEGITEEILLPEFSKKMNYDFKKLGIYVYGAGGKSKSPSLYLKIKNSMKIPVILLFDYDALEICETLNDYLMSKDKYILINKGEFEDILSQNHIKRTLNKEYEPASLMTSDDFKKNSSMCENISDFYRTRHLGEYKKSKVANLLANSLKYETDITDEIKEILSFII